MCEWISQIIGFIYDWITQILLVIFKIELVLSVILFQYTLILLKCQREDFNLYNCPSYILFIIAY
jgi:uncharacterized membrane protein